jgi:hypothetical protein
VVTASSRQQFHLADVLIWFAKKRATSILCLFEFKSANADLEDALLAPIGEHVACLTALINPRLEHSVSDIIGLRFSTFHTVHAVGISCRSTVHHVNTDWT